MPAEVPATTTISSRGQSCASTPSIALARASAPPRQAITTDSSSAKAGELWRRQRWRPRTVASSARRRSASTTETFDAANSAACRSGRSSLKPAEAASGRSGKTLARSGRRARSGTRQIALPSLENSTATTSASTQPPSRGR